MKSHTKDDLTAEAIFFPHIPSETFIQAQLLLVVTQIVLFLLAQGLRYSSVR